MDLTIDTQALKKALAIPKAVMPKNGGTISHGVRLVAAANQGGLVIQGTDLERLASTTVPANVSRPGTILVSIKDLDLLLKGKGMVRLVAEPGTDHDELQVINGMTTTVHGLDTEDWPKPWPSFDKAPAFDVDMQHVAEVLPAASSDMARPILTAVFFATDGEIVATDSYRLHIGYTQSGPKDDGKGQLLVPAGTLAQVLKLVKASKTPVPVRLAFQPAAGLGFQVQITAGPSTWYCHTISGEFPNYKALIPSSYPNKLIVSKEALTAMLVKLNGIAKKEEPVEFKPHADHVELSHRNRETQAVTTAELPGRWEGPEGQHFGFTVTYLLDMVNACREADVVIGGLDPLKPFIIGESHTDGTRSVRLIMPVRMT